MFDSVTYDPEAYAGLAQAFPLPPYNARRIFYNDTEEQIIKLLGGDPSREQQPEVVLDRLQYSIDNAQTDLERDEFSMLMEKLEEAALRGDAS